jgi:hypothetical protein
VWQVVGLVLRLMQRLLVQADQKQQQQQQQSNTQPVAAAAAAGDAGAGSEESAAWLQTAVCHCLELLQQLLRKKLFWDPSNFQHCQRMAYLLQLTEAAVRHLAAAAVAASAAQLKQKQKKKRKKKQAMGAADIAAAAHASVAVHAGPLFMQLSSAVSGLSQGVAAVLTDLAECLAAARSRRRCLRQVQLVTQAALSLLLTAAKLPDVAKDEQYSAAVCHSLCELLECLASPNCEVRCGRKAQADQPLRLLEPHPAAMVLAGRHLYQLGAVLRDLAAADAVQACEWVSVLLLGTSRKQQQQQQQQDAKGVTADLEAAMDADGTQGPLVHLLCYVLHESHCRLPCVGDPSPSASSSSSSAVAAPIGRSSAGDADSSDKGGGVGDGGSSTSAPVPRNSNGSIGCGSSIPVLSNDLPRGLRQQLCGVKRYTLELHKAVQMWRVQCEYLDSRIQSHETRVSSAQEEMTRLRACTSPSQTPAQRRLSMKVTQKELDQLWQTTQQMRQKVEATPSVYQEALHLLGQCISMLGAALPLLLPSRFCCSNPRCINLVTVSESFGLARGAASVCGRCLSGGKQPAPAHCLAAR